MTPDTLSPELQAAQDMLSAVAEQRNAAHNHVVQLSAQLAAATRRISELEAKLKEDAEPELPITNGHAANANHASA